eukprot:GILK01009091.1.p1 GENE.GILK01009091.1~~GILK01009091.1.p1  ORF type:complete len:427 (-),score=75.71 GILK01009091.1:442-1692(-)
MENPLAPVQKMHNLQMLQTRLFGTDITNTMGSTENEEDEWEFCTPQDPPNKRCGAPLSPTPFKKQRSCLESFSHELTQEINDTHRHLLAVKPARTLKRYDSASAPSRFNDDFIEAQEVGSGERGCVYKARNKMDHNIYAIKMTRRLRTHSEKLLFAQEAVRLSKIGLHPHIVRYHNMWIEDERVWIALEFCSGGSLSQALANGAVYEDLQLREMMRQLALGLEHIHSCGFAHNDIKPDNILLTVGGNYKIADFGLCTDRFTSTDCEGDCRYLAKEILQPSTESGKTDLHKCDIFSLGISMFEVISRQSLPSSGHFWHKLRGGEFLFPSSSLNQELEQLIRSCMHPDPLQRPTAQQLCAHPILNPSADEQLQLLRLRYNALEEQIIHEQRSHEQTRHDLNKERRKRVAHEQSLEALL